MKHFRSGFIEGKLHEDGKKPIILGETIFCPYSEEEPCPENHRDYSPTEVIIDGERRILYRCFNGCTRNLDEEDYEHIDGRIIKKA